LHRTTLVLLALLLVASSACTNNTFRSERDQVSVQFDGLTPMVWEKVTPQSPIVLGSQSSVSVGERACFDVSGPGGPIAPGATFVFDEVGAARFTLTAKACTQIPGAVDDGLTLQVIDPADVSPRVVRPDELEGLRWLDDGLAAPVGRTESVLAYIRPDPSAEVRLLADSPVLVRLGLRAGDAWALASRHAGSVEVTGDVAVEEASYKTLTRVFTAPAGASGRVRYAGAGFKHDVAAWRAVPADRLRSLTIAAVLVESEGGPELGLTTVVLDDEGRRVDGVPIRWQSRTETALQPDGDLTDPISLPLGLCELNRGRERRWRYAIDASFGDLSDRLTGTVLLPQRDLTDDERADLREFCPGDGCGCAVTSTPGGVGLALLGVVGAALARRRRRRGLRG
jgi:MYXO-CTERM domain-containing protein